MPMLVEPPTPSAEKMVPSATRERSPDGNLHSSCTRDAFAGVMVCSPAEERVPPASWPACSHDVDAVTTKGRVRETTPVASWARRVTDPALVALGVPPTRPVAVSSVSPAGREPATTDQV